MCFIEFDESELSRIELSFGPAAGVFDGNSEARGLTIGEFYDLMYSISVGLTFLALVMTFLYVLYGKSR